MVRNVIARRVGANLFARLVAISLVRWLDGVMLGGLSFRAKRGISSLGCCVIGFLLSTFYLLHSTCLYASDVKVKLNSTDGSTSFQVRDSGDAVVSTITSKGYALFASSVDVKGDLRVQDNEIFFGATQTDRKMYDDGTSRFATTFSSNVVITGSLRVDGVRGTYAVKVTSDTGTTAPAWLNNTSAANYGGTFDVTMEDFHPSGNVYVRAGIFGRADERGTVGLSTTTAVNVHETVGDTYGDEWAIAQWQHDWTAVAYTPWYPFTLTGSRKFAVSLFTRNSANYYGIYKAWIEIMPRP